MRRLLAKSPGSLAARSMQLPSTSTVASRLPRRSLSTINPDEVSHFANLSATWWDEQGDLNVLQRMNKVRVEFLRERLLTSSLGSSVVPTEEELEKLNGPKFLEGLKVLDVGCGGGLFAEVPTSKSQAVAHTDHNSTLPYSAWLDWAQRP